MKHIIGLVAMLLPIICGAQSPPVRALSVGDTVPDIQIANVVNNSSPKINLKDYQNKTLIIHFLLTSCSSCVASSRKYDSLLNAYGDNVKVIIVTSERKDRVEKFMIKYPSYFGKLPVVVEDSSLLKLFPYAYVSHLVWINPGGKVAAITGNEYVTLKNIRQVSSGNLPPWPVKRDIVGYEKERLLMKVNDLNIPYTSLPSSILYSSFLSYMPGLSARTFQKKDTILKTLRVTYINHTIPELYMRVFQLRAFPLSHVLINAPDPEYYFYNQRKYYKAGWNMYNKFSYECVLPDTYSNEDAVKKMINDINYNLGVNGYLKDTIVNCLILSRQGVVSLPFNDIWINDGKWMPIGNIVAHLNDKYLSTPVINEVSDLSEKCVNANLELLNDMSALQKKLALYGLALINRPVKIQALVLNQVDTFHFTHKSKLYSK